MFLDLVVDPGNSTWSLAGDILYISWIDHDPVRLLAHQEKIIFYEAMDGDQGPRTTDQGEELFE